MLQRLIDRNLAWKTPQEGEKAFENVNSRSGGWKSVKERWYVCHGVCLRVRCLQRLPLLVCNHPVRKGFWKVQIVEIWNYFEFDLRFDLTKPRFEVFHHQGELNLMVMGVVSGMRVLIWAARSKPETGETGVTSLDPWWAPRNRWSVAEFTPSLDASTNPLTWVIGHLLAEMRQPASRFR